MKTIALKPKSGIDKRVGFFVNKIAQDRGYKIQNSTLSYDDFLNDKMLLIHAIREGIPYDIFNLIKETTPFNEEDWAGFLGISTKSLQRNKIKENFVFKPLQSEKILELAEVTALGKTVFDSDEQFYLWLNTPSFALGNLKPISLLSDSYGKAMVVDELHKIDQGIFV